MKPFVLVLPVAVLMSLVVYGRVQPYVQQDQHNPVFSAGPHAPGTPTTWTFRTSTENAVARVLIDSQGTEDGAVPGGWAEVALRAQDEVHGPHHEVLSSSDVQGFIRVMSHSFGYTTDPTHGECRGTQCPDMLEVYSPRSLRLTTSGGGSFDVVAGTRPLKDGSMVVAQRMIVQANGDVIFPDLKAPPREKRFACFDDKGRLVSQRSPCVR
jgi:hypothetical protein